jgi:hypothetical protein
VDKHSIYTRVNAKAVQAPICSIREPSPRI